MKINIKNQLGQSVLELMIAMAVFVMVVSGIMFLVLDAQSANRQGAERTKSSLITQEGFEAVQSIANRGWRNLKDGDYGIDDVSYLWDWLGNSNVIDKYTRHISIAPVYRDATGNIVDIGGNLDFDSKKVTVKTSWNFTTARPSEVTLESILTNWHSTKWKQTTQTEFDLGTKNQVVTTLLDDGEVQLKPVSSTDLFNWTFDIPGDYAYTPTDIEVVSSTAQLVSQAGVISGGTVNSGFDSTLSPWVYNDWDQNSGEVNVTGVWRSGGGNPGGSTRIRVPRGRNDEVGGFIEQSFQVTETNPSVGILDFDWRVSRFNRTPVSVEVFAFLDSFPGEPIPGTQVWSSGNITGVTNYSTVNLDISSLITTPGTYYVKLATWVVSDGTRDGRFDIRFDNATVYWEKPIVGSYLTIEPTIEPTASLIPVDLVRWNNFTETATKNGGEIYYQLSDDNGTTWKYWDGSSWSVAGVGNYNIATEINTNISIFPVTANGLMFKAFLSSDGTQLVQLHDVRIDYEIIAALPYATSGTLISSPLDTGVVDPVYNYLVWTADLPASTDVQWQLRTADIEANLSTATWVGTDGTSGTYYTNQGETIMTDPIASGIQWVQYQAYLSSDGSVTPILRDITIDYEN